MITLDRVLYQTDGECGNIWNCSDEDLYQFSKGRKDIGNLIYRDDIASLFEVCLFKKDQNTWRAN